MLKTIFQISRLEYREHFRFGLLYGTESGKYKEGETEDQRDPTPVFRLPNQKCIRNWQFLCSFSY